MPGWITNGMPIVVPAIQNTTTVTAPNGQYSNVGAASLVPVDTETAGGLVPQSVAATPFQIASFAAEMIINAGTSSAAAATLNTVGGYVQTEALTTAPGAVYTFTLTNSLLTASVPAPQVQVRSGTNTGGAFQIDSVVNGSGNTVIKIRNVGTTAFNGTLAITFHT